MHFLTSRSLLGLFLLSSKKVAGTPTPSPMLLSQNKFAQQSSTHGINGNAGSYTTNATNAVDGDTNTFSHTSLEQDPWFEVDLGAMYTITYITVLNRLDEAGSRFSDATFQLFLLDDDYWYQTGLSIVTNGQIGESETFVFGTSFLIVLVHLFLLL